jgi:uncharacterized protein (DUF1778 family)
VKVEQVTIRLEAPERRQLEHAARRMGLGLTAFGRQALLERTRDVLLLDARLGAAREVEFGIKVPRS